MRTSYPALIPIHVGEVAGDIAVHVGEAAAPVPARLDGPVYSVGVPTYDGPQEVVPGRHAQVLRTDGTKVVGDIVVDPIPSNYGLVTWDGSVITVS